MVGPASLHFMVWGGQNGNFNSANRYENHHQTPQKKFMPIVLIGLQYSVMTPDVREEFWSKIKFFRDGADIHLLMSDQWGTFVSGILQI